MNAESMWVAKFIPFWNSASSVKRIIVTDALRMDIVWVVMYQRANGVVMKLHVPVANQLYVMVALVLVSVVPKSVVLGAFPINVSSAETSSAILVWKLITNTQCQCQSAAPAVPYCALIADSQIATKIGVMLVRGA